MGSTSAASKQDGMALILIAVILFVISISLMFSSLRSKDLQLKQYEQTASALSEAKSALIGFAVGDTNMPGALPCPDNNNDGISDSCGATTSLIGRVPWRTLGLDKIQDGNNECLWYALSPIFRNNIATSSRKFTSSNQISSNMSGSIKIQDVTGNVIANGVIAVVFSVGLPLAGQDRLAIGSNVCGGNVSATNYLDSISGVNNATGNFVGGTMTFVSGKASSNFNDVLIYILGEDLYSPLRKRISRELMGNVSVDSGLYKYFKSMGTYPCPSATSGNSSLQSCSLSKGYIPYNDLQYSSLGVWMLNNGWLDLASYSYMNSSTVNLTLAGGSSVAVCSASSAVVTCN